MRRYVPKSGISYPSALVTAGMFYPAYSALPPNPPPQRLLVPPHVLQWLPGNLRADRNVKRTNTTTSRHEIDDLDNATVQRPRPPPAMAPTVKEKDKSKVHKLSLKGSAKLVAEFVSSRCADRSLSHANWHLQFQYSIHTILYASNATVRGGYSGRAAQLMLRGPDSSGVSILPRISLP